MADLLITPSARSSTAFIADIYILEKSLVFINSYDKGEVDELFVVGLL